MLRRLCARLCCAEPATAPTNDKQSVSAAQATDASNASGDGKWKMDLSFLNSPTLQRALLLSSGVGAESIVTSRQLRQLIRELTLGKYLGAGGSGGKVFKASWRGSTVALKLMVSSDVDHLRITTREALLSRSLSHPHLVQTYAVHVSQLSEEDLDPITYTPPAVTAGGSADIVRPSPSLNDMTTASSPAAINGGCHSSLTAPIAAAVAHAAGGASRWEAAQQAQEAVSLRPPCSGGRSQPPGQLRSPTRSLQRTQVSEHDSKEPQRSSKSLDGPAQLAPTTSGASQGHRQLPSSPAARAGLSCLPIAFCSEASSDAHVTSSARSNAGQQVLACSAASPLALGGVGTESTFTGGDCGGRSSSSPRTWGPGCSPSVPQLRPASLSKHNLAGLQAATPSCSQIPARPVVDCNQHNHLPRRKEQPNGCSGLDHSRHNTLLDTLSSCSATQPHSNAARFLNELHAMAAVAGRYVTCVVMEYCERGTLLELIERQAGQDPEVSRLRGRRSLLPQISSLHHSGRTSMRRVQSMQSMDGSEAQSGGGGSSSGLTNLELLHNALEIALAMSYLHSLDLVHGDLKPANVLLRIHYDESTCATTGSPLRQSSSPERIRLAGLRGYCCKVADFGLTELATKPDSFRRSTTGGGLGSVAYMAPEVVANSSHGKPADVYSYGTLLWQMVTGLPPHAQLHPAQILVGLAGGELELEWPQGAERTLHKVGAACLSQDPVARPSFEHIVRVLIKAVRRTEAARRRVQEAAAAGGQQVRSNESAGSGGGAPGSGDGDGGCAGRGVCSEVWQPLSSATAVSPGAFLEYPPSERGIWRALAASTAAPASHGSSAMHIWQGFYVGSDGCGAPTTPAGAAEGPRRICLSGSRTDAAKWGACDDDAAFSFTEKTNVCGAASSPTAAIRLELRNDRSPG